MTTAPLDRINQAMAKLDRNVTSSYLEAVQKLSRTWQQETDPERYLAFVNGSAVRAAKRIAHYWACRCETFTLDKPLHVCEVKSCVAANFGPDELNLLRSRSLALLKGATENDILLYVDLSGTTEESRDVMFKCIFYLLVQASKEAGRPTMAMLLQLSETDASPPAALSTKETTKAARALLDLIQHGLPLCTGPIHVCCSGAESVLTRVASFCAASTGTSLSEQKDTIIIHTGCSPHEFSTSLRRVGLTKKFLPSSLGGTWDGFESFFRKIQRADEGWHMTEDQKQRRKRELNRIHSRQKRVRRKIEAQVLAEQREQQLALRQRLYSEHKRLKDLLRAAQRIVAGFGNQTALATASSLQHQYQLPRFSQMLRELPTDGFVPQPLSMHIMSGAVMRTGSAVVTGTDSLLLAHYAGLRELRERKTIASSAVASLPMALNLDQQQRSLELELAHRSIYHTNPYYNF